MSDTPLTDTLAENLREQSVPVRERFRHMLIAAKRFEREGVAALRERDELRAECIEQARLLDMSATREAALRARVAELEAALNRATGKTA